MTISSDGMDIRGKHVNIDFETELRYYDWGMRSRFDSEKLIAPSPFREDKSPSFFVNLSGEYAGTWKDSGWIDEDYASGNFITLLAFLRGETYEETEEYLLFTYDVDFTYDDLTLDQPHLTMTSKRNALPDDYLTPFKYRSPYLGTRGISEKVQRLARIGFDRERKAVVIPWYDSHGVLVNCKFRSVQSKVFWYAKDAIPVKNIVYGINIIYNTGAKRAVINEAEIDALTWMTMGVPAIAVGGAHFNDKKADIIKRSPIKELLLCMDNDEQGQILRKSIIKKLSGHVDLIDVILPQGFKDINEVFVAGMQAHIEYKPVRNFPLINL